MKNLKIPIILLLTLVLMSLSVNANSIWYHEANAGISSVFDLDYTGYSCNLANNVITPEYNSCAIEGSLFTPVSADFNDDGLSDIVITTANTLYFYTSDCALIDSVALGEAMNGAPIIADIGGDGYKDVIFLLDSSMEAYGYNPDTDSIVNTLSADYTGTGKTAFQNVVCETHIFTGETREENDYCILFKFTDEQTIRYDIELNTFTVVGSFNHQVYSDYYYNGLALYYDYTQNSGSDIIPICYSAGISQINYECFFLDYLGLNNFNITGIASGSHDITDMYYTSVWIAKVRGIKRIFLNTDYEKNNAYDERRYNVYSYTGDSTIYSYNANSSSNWMVGDYLKDGSSIACLITYMPNATLRCYDASFSSPIVNVDLGSMNINVTKGMVMGDFSGGETLDIAYSEAIFNANGTILFNTNLTGIDRNRSSIIFSNYFSGSPIFVTYDTDETYIIRDSNVQGVCGDGVCSYESCFTCAVDCCNPLGYECITDSDCPISYPTCMNESHKCVAGLNTTATCNRDSDCPFDSPICYFNYCVSGVSGGSGNDTADENAGIKDDEADELLNILFGQNTKIKFIIAIGLILAIMFGVAELNKSPVLIMISGVFGVILTTVIGLMPIYVMLLIMLFLLIIGVVFKFVFSSSE